MRTVVAAFLGLLATASLATAQVAQPPSPQQSPGSQASAPQSIESSQRGLFESATVLKATTRLVVLDLVATDKHGNPVNDLKSEDFKLLEDGHEQKLRAFGLQQPAPVSPSPAPALPGVPPNVFTNIQSFPRSSTLNVILLDALNTTLPNQAYARQQMLKYLQKMPDNEPIAVYVLTHDLRMLQDFSSDPRVLKEAVSKFRGRASDLLDNATGGPDQPLFAPGVFEGLPPDTQEALQRFEAERTSFQMDVRVRMTLHALQSLAKTLAGYPGRKNLIWVSESFPFAVSPDSELGKAAFLTERNYQQDVARTADALINSQVAVYPVDAAGLVPTAFSAMSTGYDTFGRGVFSGAAYGNVLQRQASALFAGHSTMNDLASRTGGKAFYNRNDIDTAIQNGIADGSTYYMLGYYPANKNWDGKFRKLTVKVDRPGITVRHRAGYYATDTQSFAKDPKARARDLAEALSVQNPPSTALLFAATVTSPSAQTGNKTVVNYRVDPHAIAFERLDNGRQHAKVGCYLQAFSEKGKPVNANSGVVEAALNPATYQQIMNSSLPCTVEIELPAGNHLLRLAVRDEVSGLIGTANAKVSVPAGSSVPVTGKAAGQNAGAPRS